MLRVQGLSGNMSFYTTSEKAVEDFREIVKREVARMEIENLLSGVDKVEQIKKKNGDLAILMEGVAAPRNHAEAYEIIGLNIMDGRT
ncbi:hypothetical protein DMENIID0001_071940 [Sergentomyia squamirostris]